MIITICSSAKFYDKIPKIKRELEDLGHQVLTPSLEFSRQDAKLKIENDLIMKHFKKIELCDAVYITNYNTNEVKGYIGGNTLMEMGLAYYLGKNIFMLNEIPKMPYTDEIIAVKPIVIGTDWDKLISK